MFTPEAFSPVANTEKEQKPALKLPRLALKLFVNGLSPEKIRRWHLFAGTCQLAATRTDQDGRRCGHLTGGDAHRQLGPK
jgi:hypothetical protein